MENYVFVSGAVLWVIIGLIAMMILWFIIAGNAYLKNVRELEKVNRELEKAEDRLAVALDKYNKLLFRYRQYINTEEDKNG